MPSLQNGLSGLYFYLRIEDAKGAIEEAYPGTKEIASDLDDEDMMFAHETDGKVDRKFQLWKYEHPQRGSLFVVNVVKVTYA